MNHYESPSSLGSVIYARDLAIGRFMAYGICVKVKESSTFHTRFAHLRLNSTALQAAASV